MANLQIKNIDEELYAKIRKLAEREHRSISQEILFLVRERLARTGASDRETTAERLVRLAGSWEDDRSAEEIVESLRLARNRTRRVSLED
ncbi:MAG: hypothetical protein KA419_12525 [Acidobacteria bacterium]|nr:hypothetical protein [Acidobacteriota bacterium]